MSSGDLAVKIPFIGRDEVSKEIKKMGTNMRRFGDTSRSIFRGIKKDSLSVKNIMGGILGARAVSAGIGLIRNQVGAVIDNMIEFDHAATKASARYGFDRNAKEFKLIGTAAREVGAATRFTAAESAKAIDAFAMANFSLNDSMRLVAPTAKLAMAADLELADSADIAASSIGIFRKEAGDFGNVADVLAFTANKTKTNLAEMFEGIKQGGGIFKTVGSDVETFSAIARALGDVKIVGSRLGTQMQTALSRIVVGGKGADKARKAIGLDKFVKDSKGNVKDLIAIIGFMQRKLYKMGEHKKLNIIRQIGGLTAMEGVNALLTAGYEKLIQYRKEAKNSMGYVDDVSAKMAQSYENKIKSIQSAIVEVGFSIIDKYGDEIPGALDTVIKSIRSVDIEGINRKISNAVRIVERLYKAAKDFVPYLKTAAVIWAGWKVNSGLTAAIHTFNDARMAVSGFNRDLKPSSNWGKMNNAIRGVTSDGVSGFGKMGKSMDSVGDKAGSLLNTFSLLLSIGYASYSVADNLFKTKDKYVERQQNEADKIDRKYSREDIDKAVKSGDLKELKKINDAFVFGEWHAKKAQKHSRENDADWIASLFAGGKSNFEKYSELESKMTKNRVYAENEYIKLATQRLNAAKVDYENKEYTKSDILNFQREANEIRELSEAMKNGNANKMQIETVVSFNGNNVPEGVSAESKVKAPPINRNSLGAN
jgi:TP901 family phage tail tape measure protein